MSTVTCIGGRDHRPCAEPAVFYVEGQPTCARHLAEACDMELPPMKAFAIVEVTRAPAKGKRRTA